MRNEKIYLPTLKRVKISNYSLFRKDIDYEFILGLNLIIGGNGIGKTTFINIVKYALIGLYKKDLDVRVYKGEKRLIRGNYSNYNTFFRNRTEVASLISYLKPFPFETCLSLCLFNDAR